MKTFAATFAAAVISTSASAAVLDFESLEQAGSFSQAVGTSYSEDGFTFTQGVGEAYLLSSRQTGHATFTGSTALYNNTVNGVTTLTKDSGDAFSISSITLSELNGNFAADVNFVGNLLGGGTVMQTFSLDAVLGNEVFAFANSFTNLLSLSWEQTAGFHQFDDLVVDEASVVPVPAGGLLLLTGLFGLGLARRRKG